jgi:hypothetical protein
VKTFALCLGGHTLFIKRYKKFSVVCGGEKKCLNSFDEEICKEMAYLEDISVNGG